MTRPATLAERLASFEPAYLEAVHIIATDPGAVGQSTRGRTLNATRKVYWWRVPDDEKPLMSLRPAELKCYLVVVRAIQRDINGGELSIRQIAKRANLSTQHAHRAVAVVVDRGLLLCNGKPGSTPVYGLPSEWADGRNDDGSERPSRSNCSPTGEQLSKGGTSQGDHHRSPTGKQNCSPTGEQHLEYSESSKSSELSASKTFQHHRRGREDDDAVQAYQQQVLELLRQRVGTPRRLSPVDRALCDEWERKGISLIVVGRAITLGCLRKWVCEANAGRGEIRISRLKYFAGVLADAQDPASGPDYWAYQGQRLGRLEAGVGMPEPKPSPSVREAVVILPVPVPGGGDKAPPADQGRNVEESAAAVEPRASHSEEQPAPIGIAPKVSSSEHGHERRSATIATTDPASELSVEDGRPLAKARKMFPFAPRENLLEAVAEMRAAQLRTVEESATAVEPIPPQRELGTPCELATAAGEAR